MPFPLPPFGIFLEDATLVDPACDVFSSDTCNDSVELSSHWIPCLPYSPGFLRDLSREFSAELRGLWLLVEEFWRWIFGLDLFSKTSVRDRSLQRWIPGDLNLTPGLRCLFGESVRVLASRRVGFGPIRFPRSFLKKNSNRSFAKNGRIRGTAGTPCQLGDANQVGTVSLAVEVCGRTKSILHHSESVRFVSIYKRIIIPGFLLWCSRLDWSFQFPLESCRSCEVFEASQVRAQRHRIPG